MLRPRVGRRLVRTAAVGGAAYMVGSHAATKAAEQQQQEADQNAQIADLQQQQATMAQAQSAPPPQPQYVAPQYAPPPQPQYATPQYAPAPPAEPAPAAAVSSDATPGRDPIEALKELGDLKAAGVLTDEEFAAKKAELLKQI